MSKSKAAPTYSIPSDTFTSIELPFTFTSNSEETYAKVIDLLGGSTKLASQLAQQDSDDPIELQLNDGDHFSHPVQAEISKTSNILVKVTTKRRIAGGDEKLYMIEPAGVINDTVRFRAMADFQYQPDRNDRMTKLCSDMHNLDMDALQQFEFLPETEDYAQNIRLFPPPMFSRAAVPQFYHFKPHSASIPTVVTRSDGVVIERLINKSRYDGSAVLAIAFSSEGVPARAPDEFWSRKLPEHSAAYEEVQQLFQERPVWMRTALINNCSPEVLRVDSKHHYFFAYSSYTFQDGPFRDMLIRFGYDPRIDPEARFYQRIMLRNLENRRKTKFGITRSNPISKFPTSASTSIAHIESNVEDVNSNSSHTFDGKHLSRSIGNYQMIDLTDPLLSKLVAAEEGLVDTCGRRDGWYTTAARRQIRAVLRRKFMALLEEPPRIVTDVECMDLLDVEIATSTDKPTTASGKDRGKSRKGKGRAAEEIETEWMDLDDSEDEANSSSSLHRGPQASAAPPRKTSRAPRKKA